MDTAVDKKSKKYPPLKKDGTPRKTWRDYKYVRGSKVIGKKADGSAERIYVTADSEWEMTEKLVDKKRSHGIVDEGFLNPNMTLREWTEYWWDTRIKSLSNAKMYDEKLRNDLLNYEDWADKKMGDFHFTSLHFFMKEYEDGRKGTVEKVLLVLKKVFRDAHKEGVIKKDITDGLKMPDVVVDERRPLNAVEREVFLEVAKEHKRGPWFLGMYYIGYRESEGRELIVSDYNRETREFIIDKATDGKTGNASLTKAGKLRKKKAKNLNSDEVLGARVLPVPDEYVTVLDKQVEGKQPNDYIFPNESGKRASVNTCRHWWRSIKRSMHLSSGAKTYRNAILTETSSFDDKITPYYLRHSFSTDVLNSGCKDSSHEYLMGHVQNTTTANYSKLEASEFNRCLRNLNRYHKKKEWKAPKGSTSDSDDDEAIYDKIRLLAELHKEGILTDDEFTSKKAEMLAKI